MALKPEPGADGGGAARDRVRTLRRALRSGRRRRWSAGTQLATALTLAALLVVLLNLLAAHLDVVWLLPARPAALSPRAATMMAATSGEIRAIALLPRAHAGFERMRQLLLNLRQAARAAGGATIEILHVDPYRDLAQASQLARRYGAKGWCVIFVSGSRHEIVSMDEVLTPAADPAGTDAVGARPRRFLGERRCVTAIARLARPVAPVVYALRGHGERDFEDYDPLNGYTDLAREIRREGYDLRPLVLGGDDDVPGDCDVLLIAGPRQAPLAGERARLEAYLARGGRLLLLIDRGDALPDGWEGIMERLGLSAGRLTAVGPRTVAGQALVVDRFGDHPIARDLRNTAVYFVAPQIIDILDGGEAADRPRASVVAAAPPGAWAEANPDLAPRHYDPASDRKGELPLVVAVERGAGTGADVGLRPLRAVVFGDSHFAVNALLAGGRTGNRDLLLNAVNWLAEGGIPAAASAPVADNLMPLGLSRRKQLRFLVRSVVAWPLAVALFGTLCIAVRRR